MIDVTQIKGQGWRSIALTVRMIVIFVMWTGMSANVNTPCPRSQQRSESADSVLTRILLTTPHLFEYGGEGYGAGLGLLDQSLVNDVWTFDRPVAAKIIELGPQIVPILIEHLSDTRLTNAEFLTTSSPQLKSRVPLGYVCLDILITVAGRHSGIVVPDCGDDGLGACIRSGFYFLPTAYDRREGGLRPKPVVKSVQKNWRRAFREGYVRFKWPPEQ